MGLHGGGPHLRRWIVGGVQEVLEEWTGQQLVDTSLYTHLPKSIHLVTTRGLITVGEFRDLEH
jgi:hypothetical protein